MMKNVTSQGITIEKNEKSNLYSVPNSLVESFEQINSHLPIQEAAESIKPLGGAIGVDQIISHVSEDRISSSSNNNCGIGFEVVKDTQGETVISKLVQNRIVHGNRTRVPWQAFIREDQETHVRKRTQNC